MIYKIGTKNAKNVNSSSNNPLSPRGNDAYKKYIFSAEKKNHLRKSSKLMEKYYEGIKRGKIMKSSRKNSNNTMSRNPKHSSRTKKSLKHSMTSNKYFNIFRAISFK